MKTEDEKATPDIAKDIERKKVDVARVLKPHFLTQSVIDVNTGKRYEDKTLNFDVVMNGTEQDFTFSDNYGFTDLDSVMLTVSADTTADKIVGVMLGRNRVRVKSDNSLTNKKIKILMVGH